jgi:hypothetical protein
MNNILLLLLLTDLIQIGKIDGSVWTESTWTAFFKSVFPITARGNRERFTLSVSHRFHARPCKGHCVLTRYWNDASGVRVLCMVLAHVQRVCCSDVRSAHRCEIGKAERRCRAPTARRNNARQVERVVDTIVRSTLREKINNRFRRRTRHIFRAPRKSSFPSDPSTHGSPRYIATARVGISARLTWRNQRRGTAFTWK